MERHIDSIQALLSYKPNLNYCDITGLDALAHALPNEYTDHIAMIGPDELKQIVRMLLKAGSDPDKPNESGKSFREMAAEPIEKSRWNGDEWVKLGVLPRSPELLAFLKELEQE